MLIFQKFPCILQNLFPWTYSTFQLTESIKILYLEWTYMIILLFQTAEKLVYILYACAGTIRIQIGHHINCVTH